MSVVLRIMSGARQGESVQFESDDFSVGGHPDCDVVFDPAENRGARGARIEVRCNENRWQARRVGGQSMLINQEILDSVLPIRSGDIIRISPEGPDIRFLVVSSLEEEHPAERMPVAPWSISSPESVAAATEGTMPAATDRRGTGATSWRRPALAAAAFLIGAVLGALLGTFWSRDQATEDFEPPPPSTAPPPPAKSADSPPTTPPPIIAPVTTPPSIIAPPTTPPPTAPSPKTPSLAAAPQRIGPPDRPRLPIAILVAHSKAGCQPFGVAAVIEDSCGHQVLLTTARLADIMSEYYWRMSVQFSAVLRDKPGDVKHLVPINGKGIYRHRLYVDTINQGNLQGAAYFNVAILVCAEKLPASCAGKVAARKTVAGIGRDSSLSACSILEPLIPAESWSPPYQIKLSQLSLRVKEVIRLDDETDADDPRTVLALDRGQMTLFEGSPVVNETGEVVAICAQPPHAVVREGRSEGPVAVPVDDKLIASLWDGQERQWVAEYAAQNPATVLEPRKN